MGTKIEINLILDILHGDVNEIFCFELFQFESYQNFCSLDIQHYGAILTKRNQKMFRHQFEKPKSKHNFFLF